MASLFEAKSRISTQSNLSTPQPTQFSEQVLPQKDLSHLGQIASSIDDSARDMLSDSINRLGAAAERGIITKALFDLEEAQAENIDTFIDSRSNPERANEALINAGQLQEIEHGLWNRLGDGATVDDINHITEAYDREISKYKRASEQGVMSVAEFEARVLKTTRDAIRRTPGLSDQLLAHADKMLRISGVRSIKDTSQEEDKQLQKRHDLIVKEGLKRHIPLNILNPDYNEIMRGIMKYDQEHSDYQALKRFNDSGNIMTAQEAKLFAQKGASAMINGGITEFMNTVHMTMTEIPDYAAAKLTVKNLATVEKQRNANILRNQGIANTPEGQQMIASYNATIDELVDSMEDYQSGKDALDFMQNKAEFARHRQDLNLRERVDVSAINILSRMDPFLVQWVLKDPKNEQRVYDMTSSLVAGALNSPIITNGILESNLEPNKSDATTIFERILSDGNPASIAQSSATLMESVRNLNASRPLEVLQFLDKHLESLGSPQISQVIKNKEIPTSVIADLVSLTDEYLTQTFHHKNTLINREVQSLSNIASELTGVGTTVRTKAEIMQDGRLFYSSNDPKLQLTLNNKVAMRYNNAIKAYASMANISTKEASRIFYDRYKDSFDIERESFDKVFGSVKGGVSDTVEKIGSRESGGRSDAKNPRSTATGKHQFIDSTWIEMLEKYRPDITGSREEKLSLRNNPELSGEMAERYKEENQSRLRNEGLPITNGTTYLAHFLGPDYAVRLLKSPPNESVENILPRSFIDSNERVLQGKTVEQVIAWAHKGM